MSSEIKKEQNKLFDKSKELPLRLLVLKKALTLYPAAHPRIKDAIATLREALDGAFSHSPYLTFNIFDEHLYFEDEPLVEESGAYANFISDCRERRIDSFTLLKGVTDADIISFLKLLNQETTTIEKKGGFAICLEQQGVSHISIAKLSALPEKALAEKGLDIKPAFTAADFKLYETSINYIYDIFQNVLSKKKNVADQAESLIKKLLNTILKPRSNVTALTLLKKHSNYTCRHSINVTILAMLLGMKLNLASDALLALGVGALFHDIGKLKIPAKLIDKRETLTDSEWRLMKSHPIKGWETINEFDDINGGAAVVAFEHHLGYDRRGYPKTKSVNRQHLFSRIVQIADSFDGATSQRSYHDARPPGLILASMYKQKNKLFDPTLLKTFIRAVGLYPLGSLVRLSDGEIAVVVDTNPHDILNPRLRLIASGGDKMSEITIDMSDKKQRRGRRIIGFVDPDKNGIDLSLYFKQAV